LKKHLKSIKKQQEVQQDAEAGVQHTASVAAAAAVAEAAQQQLLQEEGDDGQPQVRREEQLQDGRGSYRSVLC
jgi:ribosomal protein S12 methylthiotransferase accessory factor YcaO